MRPEPTTGEVAAAGMKEPSGPEELGDQSPRDAEALPAGDAMPASDAPSAEQTTQEPGASEALEKAAETPGAELLPDEEEMREETRTEPAKSKSMTLALAPIEASETNSSTTESVGGEAADKKEMAEFATQKSRTRNEQQIKSWKKNISMVWQEIAAHRFGSMFINPIRAADAPNYYEIVKKPLDLKTIKNRIRDEEITTTAEFYRDIMHMFNNALMYNEEDTEVYQMTLEIIPDAQRCIEQLLQTEAMVESPVSGIPPSTLTAIGATPLSATISGVDSDASLLAEASPTLRTRGGEHARSALGASDRPSTPSIYGGDDTDFEDVGSARPERTNKRKR
ncbi:hypothetical protein EV182_000883 [Spiromyces aspiralis]|uniref:Uncharacterized protein n=1 Tax=Spiromyces aspiralis TaxID=68401 RepID=A0ACC1HHX0_9FUNG|nr:hypothetical protein EV182_000883 [Spiromyces aspiralis]